MRQRPAPPDFMLLETQDQIDEFCARCRSEGRFAFDTEFVMEDRYESEVCLIQMAVLDTVAIIDPCLDLHLDELWHLVGDDQVETVVHAGQEDLALSVQKTGRPPRRVFDVQIAVALTGAEYPISLQRLVQQILHIRLHKSGTLTDWRKRPLSEAQIRYAVEDVAHLLAVRQKIHDKLEHLERLAWAREEFVRLEDVKLYQQPDEDKLMRIKGTGKLDGRQLAIAREVLAWRAGLAKHLNRPARVVLKDHLLVEISKHQMTQVGQIRELRGANLNNANLRALAGVVAAASELPSSEWPTPEPRTTTSPGDAALTALATAVIRSYCLENRLAYSLVATQQSIRELIAFEAGSQPSDDHRPNLLCGWRGSTVGALLADVISGRRVVRVEAVNGERRIHIAQRDDSPK